MKAVVISLLFGSVVSFSAFAGLSLPQSVDLLAVNGKKVKETRSIELPTGDNQLVIRYSQVLKDGSARKMFESKPLVVTVTVADSNQDMAISHKQFRDYQVAKAAFRNAKAGWMLTTDGNGAYLATSELPGNPGLFPYQDIERAIKAYNFQYGISLVTVDLEVETPASNAREFQIGSASDTAKKQQQLKVEDPMVTEIKKWYLQANDQERKALLKWMIENN